MNNKQLSQIAQPRQLMKPESCTALNSYPSQSSICCCWSCPEACTVGCNIGTSPLLYHHDNAAFCCSECIMLPARRSSKGFLAGNTHTCFVLLTSFVEHTHSHKCTHALAHSVSFRLGSTSVVQERRIIHVGFEIAALLACTSETNSIKNQVLIFRR